MEQQIYERPREKLQYRGAAFLLEAELIQVILGSGTARISVASLSRRVSKLIKKEGVNYSKLRQIKGVGHVKACQVLASLELGKRYGLRFNLGFPLSEGSSSFKAYTPRDQRVIVGKYGGRSSVTCFWVDGSGLNLGYTNHMLGRTTDSNQLARYVAADALRLSARRLIVYVSTTSKGLVPTPDEIAVATKIKQALYFFNVQVSDIVGVNKSEHTSWLHEVAQLEME